MFSLSQHSETWPNYQNEFLEIVRHCARGSKAIKLRAHSATWGFRVMYKKKKRIKKIKKIRRANESFFGRRKKETHVLGERKGCWCFLLQEIITIFDTVAFYTSTISWRGYIFIAVCLCVCVCEWRESVCQWTKFQPNEWTDLDAVFAK